jgi:hypothetical protein
MSRINVEPITCPRCSSAAAISERCFVCLGNDRACRACSGTGRIMTCAKCSFDHAAARRPVKVFALQSKIPLPGSAAATSRFWTGQDYTSDIDRALTFKHVDEANRWLGVHRHLRGSLRVVEVEVTQEAP